MMTKMSGHIVRPCDGCALRRVRCNGSQPCHECGSRSIQCTFLRPRGKRGPKGKRIQTTIKISSYQQSLVSSQNLAQHEVATLLKPLESTQVVDNTQRIPVCAYATVLELFRKQLFSIWPIVSCRNLVETLESGEADHESYAFAAAVCAGALAQLRVTDDSPERAYVSATRFEKESQYYRTLFSYREAATPSSLLTSLFLHMFRANNHKFELAEWYLREAVIYLQRLSIHKSSKTPMADHNDRELHLRIYWVVYVTERTFCAQHNLEAMLDPIPELPQPCLAEDPDAAPLTGLVMLAQVFSYLHKDVLRSLSGASHLSDNRMSHDMVSYVQSRLSVHEDSQDQLNETQRVDLIVTRSWIRTLLWHYTLSNFLLHSRSEDEAFSCFLPELVARDFLIALSSPTEASLRAHGYGIELKVFKLADSLLDVLACGSQMERAQSIRCSSRDVLGCLEQILLVVGGRHSTFLDALHERMREMNLRTAFTWWSANNSEQDQGVLCGRNSTDETKSMQWRIENNENGNMPEYPSLTSWSAETTDLIEVF